MLFTIFHKIWHFEKKMHKNAKTSFCFERDYIYTYIHQQISPGRQKGHIIPICYSNDLTESKCYKTTHTNWVFGWNRPRSTFETETTKSHFILQSLFRQEHSKPPRQISVAGILYVSPSTHIFSNPIVKI